MKTDEIMKWFYLSENNEVIGPVSESALGDLKACGAIENETRICREGTEVWITFAEIPTYTSAPPDMPGTVKFHCPHCSQHIVADASHAGMEAQCPSCSGKMLVPKVSPSHRERKKLVIHARTKVVLLSVLGLAGLLAIGGIVHWNGSRSSRMPSATKQTGGSEVSIKLQEKETGGLTKYRFSAGPLPNLSRPVPEGFVLIPEGSFTMGDSLDGMKDAAPHEVHLSSFYIGRHEVTRALWKRVTKWGQENGYPGLPAGSNDSEFQGEGKNPLDKDRHPAYWIGWYNVLKWCNAYSEMEGMRPCYLLDGKIIRGSTFLEQKNEFLISCDFSSNGYRLPTEAEWEKAARGGKSGLRFPWGNTINQRQAYYTARFDSEPYQEIPTISQVLNDSDLSDEERSELLGIASGRRSSRNSISGEDKRFGPRKISGVGSFPPNDYGLYDMIGSATEWCWDCYDKDFYRDSPKWDSYDKKYFRDSPKLNPIGPPVQVANWENHAWRSRVFRGGDYASGCRVAARQSSSPNFLPIGFRLVCR
jgi:formylglycine-generating enzyme required for sulfatase activity/DNA-directed RNA polymerase subunit RPC12/RpoP